MTTSSPYNQGSSSSPTAKKTPYSYLPPSFLTTRVHWDVFLNFRGEDTRGTIATSLYTSLLSNGVRSFMDDEGMAKGDTILPTLEEAIVDSALAIAILSPRYADSRWCLDELSKIFDSRKRVIPVFFRVDPSDVRGQKNEFGEGFWKLWKDPRFDEDEVQRWRLALTSIGNISGYTCRNESDEPELIRRIVTQVLSELKNTPEYVVKFAVGVDSRVNKVLAKLNIKSNDVKFLGLHGTPGIGKTTLAKATFNKLVSHFKNRCFISNVRETLANTGGVLHLQNKLICDLSSGDVRPVTTELDAIELIKKIVSENKVLIVLDDVSEADQLNSLGILRKWFEEGSRIIVTSRNVRALSVHPDELYEAVKLDDLESLELFSIHALGRREPTKEYWDVSKDIVSVAGGLPLALEVFGSSLVKKSKSEWEDALKKLGHIRPNNLQDVLKLSYDGLDDQEKTIFLDISCLLLQKQMKRREVVDVLEGCDLRAEVGIGNLVAKSLVKIREDNILWMHDQIRDMGRQIVLEECLDDPGKRTRLWDSDHILHVFRCGRVTEAIQGIALDTKKPADFTDETISWIDFRRNPNISTSIKYLTEKVKNFFRHGSEDSDHLTLNTKSFEKMTNMKLLRIDYVKLQGDYKHFPSDLRWLQWRGCPLKTLSVKLPQGIRMLDLSESRNLQSLWASTFWSNWGFNKVGGNLTVINLSRCPSLTALPDMSAHRHLKRLVLELCVGLTSIHESIGNLSSLVVLDLRHCSNLVDFPKDVTGMKGLQELILSDCYTLYRLPRDVRSMKSLVKLYMDGTKITELPENMFHLIQLEVLNLNNCEQIKLLPEWIGSLSSLKEFTINGTQLIELPNSIGLLTRLEKLSLIRCTSLTSLPDSVRNLKSLVELNLHGSALWELPASVCSLSYLKFLSVGKCRSLHMLPVSIEGLLSIVELHLDGTPITEIPDQIRSLKFLENLQMIDCSALQRLPEPVGSMSNLTKLSIVGAAITELPESIADLENLVFLRLDKCRNLRKLPDKIGKLKSLVHLLMVETSVTCLPESFGLLESLMVFKIKKPLPESKSTEPYCSLVLPATFFKLCSLEEFDARVCRISGQINDDFSKLSNLEILNLGYNNFNALPSSLEGLCVLKKLSLYHCEELRSLPRLPSTLLELNAADCYALEMICDLSNLERLQELQLANCAKLLDVPGLESLKSLRRLYLGGCSMLALSIRNRLSRVALRKLNNLSVPGSEIPDWFSKQAVDFTAHPNLAIKSVIVGVAVSVDFHLLDDVRIQPPSIIDIQARILRQGRWIFSTVLSLLGVPITREDQLYLCRFKDYHPLVSLLKEGDSIEVGWRSGPASGVEVRDWGVHLVFENDDDYDGDEDVLQLDESQQSVSQKLVRFFRSKENT